MTGELCGDYELCYAESYVIPGYPWYCSYRVLFRSQLDDIYERVGDAYFESIFEFKGLTLAHALACGVASDSARTGMAPVTT